jgi:protein tyrosine/serine phosphatase
VAVSNPQRAVFGDGVRFHRRRGNRHSIADHLIACAGGATVARYSRGMSAQREFAMIESDVRGGAAAAAEAGWRRVVAMERINNFRDYGDLPTRGGGRVRKGLLFRSAHHARASAADAARLTELGITTVTDLRHPGEQAEQPSTWRGSLVIEVIEEAAPADGEPAVAPHNAALANSDFSADAMAAYLQGHYGTMPFDPRHVRLWRRYFAALAEREGGMLIHCAAGKDRTGILAWLTHHVLDVHPDDRLADYLMSNEAAAIAERLPMVQRRLEQLYARSIAPEALLAMLTVRPEFMDNALRAIGEHSGSVDAYLEAVLGVDAARREAIRARLIG